MSERTYQTMADKSIGKCASGHWLPLTGNCDLCGASADQKCMFLPNTTSEKAQGEQK